MTTATAIPQHLAALDVANVVRLAGAAWRHDVGRQPSRVGLVVLAEALEPARIPDHVGALTLSLFLRSAQRVGARRASRILAEAGLIRDASTARVRDLTLRERSVLAAYLCELAERKFR